MLRSLRAGTLPSSGLAAVWVSRREISSANTASSASRLTAQLALRPNALVVTPTYFVWTVWTT